MRTTTKVAGVVLFATLAMAGCTDRSPSPGPTVIVTAVPSANPGGRSAGPSAVEPRTPTVTGPGRTAAPALLPLRDGVVRVTTESGTTSCNVRAQFVECQSAEFAAHRRTADGRPASGFRYTAGALEWYYGNMSVATPPVTIAYGRTYTAAGWTITAACDATVFRRGGHGVRVDVANTTVF
ncbi:hypothetical protein [Tsukamurella sp. NPDC003166]|uniref:hypothetical protein n=1 Tax=Tsukamurella sp. NPDC003166 TaxID=3154444 RepID=UPI0033ABAAEA